MRSHLMSKKKKKNTKKCKSTFFPQFYLKMFAIWDSENRLQKHKTDT